MQQPKFRQRRRLLVPAFYENPRRVKCLLVFSYIVCTLLSEGGFVGLSVGHTPPLSSTEAVPVPTRGQYYRDTLLYFQGALRG